LTILSLWYETEILVAPIAAYKCHETTDYKNTVSLFLPVWDINLKVCSYAC